MITIKSNREIELMKKAGYIVGLCHHELKDFIKVGVSTNQINEFVRNIIIENEALPSFEGYSGFPYATCISVNEVVVHGFPSDYVLKSGDIVSVDIGANYKGYHGDSAWTYMVGNCNEEDRLLLERTEQALYDGLRFAKAGNYLSDISHAIEQSVKKYGYGVVEEFTGHGIGNKLHEDPAIPNFGAAGEGPILKNGMTLAIEPMINLGTKNVKIMLDGWTTKTVDGKKSAHFEHTVLITEDECLILTKI